MINSAAGAVQRQSQFLQLCDPVEAQRSRPGSDGSANSLEPHISECDALSPLDKEASFRDGPTPATSACPKLAEASLSRPRLGRFASDPDASGDAPAGSRDGSKLISCLLTSGSWTRRQAQLVRFTTVGEWSDQSCQDAVCQDRRKTGAPPECGPGSSGDKRFVTTEGKRRPHLVTTPKKRCCQVFRADPNRFRSSTRNCSDLAH